jgi:hypothetical protein
MKNTQEEQMMNKPSFGTSISLALISTVLGSTALWFTWFRYSTLSHRPEFQWYEWTQPIFAAVMGILCVSAAVLFLVRKPSGWSTFKTGLSMVPLMLFTNLLILLARVILNIFQGNGPAFVSRLYASPLNKAILVLVILLVLWSVIKETKK